jgi:lipoprotein-releasing system permease protein
VIGLTLGLVITFNVNWIDLHLVSPIIGHRIFQAEFYVFRDIPVRVDPFVIGTIVVAAVVVSLLASLIPAWKAARLNAVESLRYE